MAFSLDFIRPGEGTATRNTLEDGSYLVGRGTACHIRLARLLFFHCSIAPLNKNYDF